MRFLISIVFFVICSLPVAQAQLHEIARLKSLLETKLSPQERADTYARLGMSFANRHLDSSYFYAAMGLDLAKYHHDRQSEARALNVMAHYHMEKGQPVLAYKLIHESLSLFQQLGMKYQVCELTMNLGVMLVKEGKIEQGMTQYEAANKLSLELENDSVRTIILLNMAVFQSRNLPYHELEKLYDEVFWLATKYQQERELLVVRQLRNGLSFRKQGATEKIIETQREIVRELMEKGYESVAVGGYMELGHLFLKDQLDSAVYYFEKAISLSEDIGYDALNFSLIGQTYDILKARNPNSPKVAAYSDRMLQINKKRNLEAQAEGLSFMELAIMEKDFEIQQAKLRIRQMWIFGLTLVGLLALVFGVLVSRQLLIKRKLAKDLEQINMRLSLQNTQLEENNEFHKKLISMLSHDLRQPFSTIIMMSNEIFDQLDERQRRVVFDEICQSANVSLQTMDGLLYWMKLQMLGLADSPTSVLVADSIEHAMEFNRSLIRMRNIEIIQDINESFAVLVQPEIMLFVNRNLIHNAIKHTPQGNPVRISATHEATGHVLIRVSDTGFGIPQDKLPNLFKKSNPDTEGLKGHQDTKTGAGLALIICREMIEKMGGAIWAENNRNGVGASFLYRLPVANPVDMDETKYGKSNKAS